jgi:hypothetical protein
MSATRRACTEVTTIVAGTSADPHDEPTAADTTFGTAKLAWSAASTTTPGPRRRWTPLDQARGRRRRRGRRGDEGEPTIWYGPEDVDRIASAITVS